MRLSHHIVFQDTAVIILALLIGIIAGLRTMMAPVVIAWAVAFGKMSLEHTWLAFMGWRFTGWIFLLLVIGELVTDQLPSTPSRKVPVQFGARLLSGGASGAAIGYSLGSPFLGLALGIGGAVIGTLGGAAVRARLSATFGSDRPAALIEDTIAIAGALLVFAEL
jgi:uncharacterized membrane protein